MLFKMSHTSIAVITIFTFIGRVVSQDPPPTIHDRTCYLPGTITAPVADCQSAIDKLISQTGYVDGPTISCLETAWSGNCGINICSDVNVRPQAIAATAQDILSGCRSSGKGSTVGGFMTMSGFATSADGFTGVNGLDTSTTGGVGGDITITMRTRMFGPSKRNVEDANDTPPTRVHAKDLSIPHRIEARDPAPTWEAGGGYELVLLDSQNPGWQIDPGLATTLASNLRNNWGVQPGTHFTAYDQQQMGAGTTVANGFYAASNYELADVDPDVRFPLATALHAFRNQQGNPGWFAVQVLSGGRAIGDMFFDLTQQGGLNLL